MRINGQNHTFQNIFTYLLVWVVGKLQAEPLFFFYYEFLKQDDQRTVRWVSATKTFMNSQPWYGAWYRLMTILSPKFSDTSFNCWWIFRSTGRPLVPFSWLLTVSQLSGSRLSIWRWASFTGFELESTWRLQFWKYPWRIMVALHVIVGVVGTVTGWASGLEKWSSVEHGHLTLSGISPC